MVLTKALDLPIILDFSEDSKFSHFSCIANCNSCCGFGYFLPPEIKNLPNFIKKKLIFVKDGKYEVTKLGGRCIFYNPSSKTEFFCSIHDIRPLRCKIYPYFPLIVNQRVVITLEPALKMMNHTTQIKHCPGIGKTGKSLKETIKDCYSFLRNLSTAPQLLSTIILTNENFNSIRNDRWFIEYNNDGE